jgi:hypothetical protein
MVDEITDSTVCGPVGLTVGEILALHEAVDHLAKQAFAWPECRWPRWRKAATADTRLFDSLPKAVQDSLVKYAEEKQR